MAEAVRALAGLAASPGGGRVMLAEFPVGAIMQVQAWPDAVQAAIDAIATLFPGDVPPLGRAADHGEAIVAHVAPGRFMIAGTAEDLPARLSSALPASAGAVTDLSHGRAILVVEGEAAEAVLQKCVALDLAPAAFPVGRAAASMIHHVDVLIVRRAADKFELWALRSFAEALAEWLLDAGLEEGIGLRS